MISDNRKNKDSIVRNYTCPYCGSKEEMIINGLSGLSVYDGKAYLYDCFCRNCKKYNSIYIDIVTKEIYTTHREYYTYFPERYDLKKYLGFLVDRIDCIRQETQEILENSRLKVNKEILEKIKSWNEVCDFRSIDTYSLLQDLLLDPKDEKYIVDIKKVK